MKKEVKTIRAAKCYFGAGTARLSEARISKTHPRKGTETGFGQPYRLKHTQISKTHPRKGTETLQSLQSRKACSNEFQKHIPARGRKLVIYNWLYSHTITEISKTHPRKGTETIFPRKGGIA